MSTLIGILVDVSASMKCNAVGEINDKGEEWARSVFSVIDNLIKQDISADNKVFAIAVGASCGTGTFDILGTIKALQTYTSHRIESLTYEQTIKNISAILEKNGSRLLRFMCAFQMDVIQQAISIDMARLLLILLESDHDFVQFFIHECLPLASEGVKFPGESLSAIIGILNILEKAKSYFLVNVSPSCIIDIQEASRIVHECVDDRELTKAQINRLMAIVEPFIYGRTPMYQALDEIKKLFLQNTVAQRKNLLFVLSDGEPTDNGNFDQLVSELHTANVTVVSCYITKTRQVDPKRLYSLPEPSWDEHAKFLFRLSSRIPTQLLPRTIFIKRGWTLDIDNNETKLFLHINHPEILKEVCDLARNVVCCQDALSDLLASASLDLYINQSTSGFQPQLQVGGTCYANASAAVIHLAMKRILGRDGGYPDFDMLRQDMITLHGVDGASTLRVLQDICPKYRLHCREVSVSGAMNAISAKRPVVAIFRLTDSEWSVFSNFFNHNPTGILSKRELNIMRPTTGLKGHAVVMTSFNSECIRLMNSWGTAWADMGFFRVQNTAVLDLKFIDVFWTLNDLSEGEKMYYQEHGGEVASNLIQKLKCLQTAKYECPLCRRESFVTEFTGTLLQANCPLCDGIFRSDEAGNILALNMYLVTLTR